MQSVYRRVFHYTDIIDASVGVYVCLSKWLKQNIFNQMYTVREVSDGTNDKN